MIKTSKILVTNLEIPIETALHSLEIAKANNGLTIILLLNFKQSSFNLVISQNTIEFIKYD
jgi:hypothetical protein